LLFRFGNLVFNNDVNKPETSFLLKPYQDQDPYPVPGSSLKIVLCTSEKKSSDRRPPRTNSRDGGSGLNNSIITTLGSSNNLSSGSCDCGVWMHTAERRCP
jgi:hypothetical protein